MIPPGPDMRMPGRAPGAAAPALPLCVTGGVLRWVVDTAGRPHQQSSAGALARADSAYSVSDKNWRDSEVIQPGPDMRMSGGATGAAAPVLPLCVTDSALRWAVDTAGRPHQQSSTGGIGSS